MSDFFAELEAEIAKHTEQARLKADREKAKKRANTVTLSSSARRAATEEFKAIDAILAEQEWAAVKTVALFTEQACDGCGSVHRVFLQYMELQQMIRRPSTQRWVRVSKPSEALPRESLLQPMTTHICADCCEDHGFALLSAPRLSQRAETFAPSFTYHQEDINA